ncbi:MAG: sulfatase-like hydrolase/transferase [Chitinophagales bacterium]
MKYFLLVFVASFIVSNSFAQCTSHKVTSISLTNQTGCSSTLNWTPAINTSYFTVSKKVKGTSQWSPPLNVGYTSSYTFSGLKLNKKYSFQVTAYCQAGAIGKSRSITQQQFYASPPAITVAECIFPQQIHVKWQPCSKSNKNRIQTRQLSTTTWSDHFTGTSTEFYLTVTGVEPVLYRITSCIDTTQGWTGVDTIYLAPTSSVHKPNIITIMLDDARFDVYSCNGAPSIVQTPNIDRIANEGVNFKNSYVTYSLCNPSRATYFTGLYAHHHGATDNVKMFYPNLPTIATTLDTAGYYTVLIGKYMNATDNNPLPQPGYDYWMGRYKGGLTNPKFVFSDSSSKVIPGYINDIETDTAVRIIETSNQPFYIDLNYSTHPPYRPRPQEDTLFDGVTFPLPDNYYPFTQDYPNFLYPTQNAEPADSLEQSYRDMYEVMIGVDSEVARLFGALEASGKLDSTLIILTSDNGYMLGEHYLEGKRMTYEPSARVPIFMRYPSWFAPGSLDENDYALNIDFAATILDAAGIPNAFPSDGISLRKLLYDQERRTKFYYEITDVIVQLANSRSVFSPDYKYNYYYCNQVTEEFFDLINDPEEDTNQINNPVYQDLIQYYRTLKDSFRTALTDTINEEIHSCSLANGLLNKLQADEEIQNGDLLVYPNPADEKCRINFPESLPDDANMEVRNAPGSELKIIPLKKGMNHYDLDAKKFSSGLYLIQINSGPFNWESRLIISR